MKNIVQATGLKKHYGKADAVTKALDGVDFCADQGDFIAIVGTSGSGKTTLLNMLGGLDKPDEGQVLVRGQNLLAMNDEQLSVFRRRNIGFVFQSYNLVPALSVEENILLPLRLDGLTPDNDYYNEIIDLLKIREKLHSLPTTLSGGQQQRVAIARALCAKPAVMLADEPTGNLDSRTSNDVLGLLKAAGQKFAQTIVMITHNIEIAQLADRIVRIEDGRIVQGGQHHG